MGISFEKTTNFLDELELSLEENDDLKLDLDKDDIDKGDTVFDLALDLEVQDSKEDELLTMDINLSNDKERLRKIISRNIIYENYRINVSNKKANKISTHSFKGLKKELNEFFESSSNIMLDKKGVILAKNQISSSLNNLEDKINIFFSSENILNSNNTDAINFEHTSSEFDKIMTEISFPKKLFSLYRGMEQKLKEYVLNIIVEKKRERDTILANQNLKTMNLESYLKSDKVVLNRINKIEFNISTLNQEVVCPVCGKKQIHNIINLKNTYKDYENYPKQKCVMFEHMPLICEECGSLSCLSEEEEDFLDNEMNNIKYVQLLESINSQKDYIERIAFKKITPDIVTLNSIDSISTVGEGDLISEGIGLFANLDKKIEARKLNYISEEKFQLKYRLRDLFEGERSDALTNHLNNIIEYNSKNLYSLGITMEDAVCKFLMSSKYFLDLKRRREKVNIQKKNYIFLDKILSALKVLKSKNEKEIELSSEISLVINDRIAFLNENLKFISGAKYSELNLGNYKRLSEKYFKTVENILNETEQSILFEENIIKESLEYFKLCKRRVLFSSSMSKNKNSINNIKEICWDDKTYKEIINLTIPYFAEQAWAKYIMKMDLSSTERVGGIETEVGISKKRVVSTIKKMNLERFMDSNKFTNIIKTESNVDKYILKFLLNELQKDNLFKVRFYTIMLWEKKDNLKENSRIKEYLENTVKSIDSETLELFKMTKELGSDVFEKCCFLKEEGYSKEEITTVVEEDLESLKSWVYCGINKTPSIKNYIRRAVTVPKKVLFLKNTNSSYCKLISELKIMDSWNWYTENIDNSLELINDTILNAMYADGLNKFANKVELMPYVKEIKYKKELISNNDIINIYSNGKVLLNRLLSIGSITNLTNISGSNLAFEEDGNIELKCYTYKEYEEHAKKIDLSLKVAVVIDLLGSLIDNYEYERLSYFVEESRLEEAILLFKLYYKGNYTSILNTGILKFTSKQFSSLKGSLELILEDVEERLGYSKRKELEAFLKNKLEV